MRLSRQFGLAFVTAAGLVALPVSPVQGQVERDALIGEARQSADEAERRDLYVAAAEPVGIDSLWAVATFEIAQIMMDLDDQDAAVAWMRWATRHGAWDIDRAYFAPSLVRVYDDGAAGLSQEPEPESGGVRTDWTWPAALETGAPGTLSVDASTPGLAVEVVGQGAVVPGDDVSLAPGTYRVLASADGFDALEVEREVLPGVRTVVTFDLFPVLADPVVERVAESLVRLRPVTGAGAGVCRSGISVGDDLVVTSLTALAGATMLEVLPADGPALPADLLETDADADVAVLGVPTLGGSALPEGSLEGRRFGWSVYGTGCDPLVQASRARMDASGPLVPLPPVTLGAPFVDASGSWMGLVTTGGGVSTLDRVHEVIDAAAAQLETGGFPTLWVAAGAAAVVGGVVIVLAGGGGGGGGGEDTGTIRVPLPVN